MGKKPRVTEEQLAFGKHPDLVNSSVVSLMARESKRGVLTKEQEIIDTHCHLLSTFTTFREKFKESETDTIQSFVQK